MKLKRFLFILLLCATAQADLVRPILPGGQYRPIDLYPVVRDGSFNQATILQLTVTSTGNLTPKIVFSGTADVFIGGAYHSSLASNVEATIPVVSGQSIDYVFSDWDSVTVFDLHGDPIKGDISVWTLPASLVTFYVSSTGVYGDISVWTLPASLVTFYVFSTGVSGDISVWTLPASLVTFSVYSTGVSGDISVWTLPASLVNFYVNSTGVSGDISVWTLPASLVNFYVSSTGVSGDISVWTLPASLVTFSVFSTGVSYASGGAFIGITTALTKIDFDSCGLSQAHVDNILVDCDAAGVTDTATIEVAGSNAAPGAAGLTAKSNLEGRGYTVTVTP